jgi:hypothetical protein
MEWGSRQIQHETTYRPVGQLTLKSCTGRRYTPISQVIDMSVVLDVIQDSEPDDAVN